MKKMTNDQVKSLALTLLRADTEDDVIKLLKNAGLWDDRRLWRLYGDKEGNFAQAGNQQSQSEASLVEKIINCVDARLMAECLSRGIDPESESAPTSIRDAVAMFFEGRRAEDDEAGTLTNWTKGQRTDESRAITIAATGGRPTKGRRAKNMCLTVSDLGEGQSPTRLPNTILSLNAKNKQRIRFVQGKFNMGGSGALRFCGEHGLQLVISRRHPELADKEREQDSSVDSWSVTIVRREEPSNKSGEPIHSEFTYLAPVGADTCPRGGAVLSFDAETLPLMPQHDEAYSREITWGTTIKLYEFETTVGQSNILLKGGLLFALERLLPEIALPVRIHECRGYRGEKERSFETPLAGLVVRLEDGKGDNLEHGFPKTSHIHSCGISMTARIYAFKEDKASTYLRGEGVIFTINGQAHGYLPKSIFSRPKKVRLPRLKDSLLVVIDCSKLTARQREDLFMTSRDRLSKKTLRYAIEGEIEEALRGNPELKRLQQDRRKRDVESKLSDQRPLEEVLGRVLKASPTLKTLFLQGQRLTRPFAAGSGGNKRDDGGTDKGKKEFKGRAHPTYFRIKSLEPGAVYSRNCEHTRRCRIKFETDVENEYFERATYSGRFDLDVVDSTREVSTPSYSLTLSDGDAYLSLALPSEVEIGDRLVLQTTVSDDTLKDPLVNVIALDVIPKQEHPSGPRPRPKSPNKSGGGDEASQRGIALPKIILVREGDNYYVKHKFTGETACHVISDPIEVDGKETLDHVFYINIDNTALQTEMKYAKRDARLLQAKFEYGNVLLGLAMLHSANGELSANSEPTEDEPDEEKETIQDRIGRFSSAIAPVLLPMIDQLGGLDEDDLDVLSETGEDG